jgi:acyl-homoserine lactone acylase PvdQ
MKIALTACFLTLTIFCFGQVSKVDLNNISIARDTWGVPHIFTKTDVEAAYGLAWAHCEDNFEQIQEPFLAAKRMLGTVLGKEGVEKIESISCYGAFNRPDSPHYNDQMDLYMEKKVKVMSLNKETILKAAEKVYHPE